MVDNNDERGPTLGPMARRFVALGAVACIAVGVADLVAGTTVGGAILLVVGTLTLGGLASQLSPRLHASSLAQNYHVLKAYAFFWLCAIGGAVLAVLGALGAVQRPAAAVIFGLAAMGLSAYVLALGLKGRRRRR